MAAYERLRSSIIWGLISITFLSYSSQSYAQSQKQPTANSQTKTEGQVIKCFAYVAMVKVEVRDQHGKEVTDLLKDDFILYEDGRRQELCLFRDKEGAGSQTHQAMYEMGYYPINFMFNQFKGEFRKIRVIVRSKGKRNLRVEFSPKGYFAKKELLK